MPVDVIALTLHGVDLSVGVPAFYARLCFGLAVALVYSSFVTIAGSTLWAKWYSRRGVAVVLTLCGGACGCIGMVFGGVVYDRVSRGSSGTGGVPGASFYLCLVATLLTLFQANAFKHANRLNMTIVHPTPTNVRINPLIKPVVAIATGSGKACLLLQVDNTVFKLKLLSLKLFKLHLHHHDRPLTSCTDIEMSTTVTTSASVEASQLERKLVELQRTIAEKDRRIRALELLTSSGPPASPSVARTQKLAASEYVLTAL